jgi:hypothetical protein
LLPIITRRALHAGTPALVFSKTTVTKTTKTKGV